MQEEIKLLINYVNSRTELGQKSRVIGVFNGDIKEINWFKKKGFEINDINQFIDEFNQNHNTDYPHLKATAAPATGGNSVRKEVGEVEVVQPNASEGEEGRLPYYLTTDSLSTTDFLTTDFLTTHSAPSTDFPPTDFSTNNEDLFLFKGEPTNGDDLCFGITDQTYVRQGEAPSAKTKFAADLVFDFGRPKTYKMQLISIATLMQCMNRRKNKNEWDDFMPFIEQSVEMIFQNEDNFFAAYDQHEKCTIFVGLLKEKMESETSDAPTKKEATALNETEATIAFAQYRHGYFIAEVINFSGVQYEIFGRAVLYPRQQNYPITLDRMKKSECRSWTSEKKHDGQVSREELARRIFGKRS